MSRFYVVLCEDLQSRVFIYRVLRELGVDPHNIRIQPYPDNRVHSVGGGSPRRVKGYLVYACGAQHILMNYPAELAEIRTQSAKRDAALVVHIDVDNATPDGRTMQDRRSELDDACASKGVPKRTEKDPVALLVPRREMETWIHFFLQGPPIVEHVSYPKLTGHEADAEPAAIAFARHAKTKTVPLDAIPSLVDGLAELRRVI